MKERFLPKGFFDYCGDEAECMLKAAECFLKNGRRYGFVPAALSEVGFRKDYEDFGTASNERSYTFCDMGGNDLMLASDSLASTIRMYRGAFDGCRNIRVMSVTPVFRCRKKKYRRWHHLIYTMINESDCLNAEISLFEMANTFLSNYYNNFRYSIYLYEIFDAMCEYYGNNHKEIYTLLYLKYQKGEKICGDLAKQIEQIEQIGISSSNWMIALKKISDCFPWSKNAVDFCMEFLHFLDVKGINYKVEWDNYHAIEYSSGICFLVKDDKGRHTLADGGAYNYVVKKYNNIRNCYSFACSLEAIRELVEIKENNNLYLVKLDCSYVFFHSAAEAIRKRGIPVFEVVSKGNLNKALKSVPVHSRCCLVGKEEEEKRELIIEGEMIKI